MTATAQHEDSSAETPHLYVAFDLGDSRWHLALSDSRARKPRLRSIVAGDLNALAVELERAKKRFGLSQDAAVRSCYESGRDGFWLHRCLEARGVQSVVVDSASLEVNRRARRVKTDRVDAGKLLSMLLRYWAGERKLWAVLRIPSVAEEDQRHLHREMTATKTERTRITNRIKGLLVGQGVKIALKKGWIRNLSSIRLWNGEGLPECLEARLRREWAKVELLGQQIRELEAQRRDALSNSKDPTIEKVRRLMLLRGIGIEGAWVNVMELFAWRRFKNRREVGGVVGLTASPWRSGRGIREQGISKAGNPRVRSLAVELAWCWLRYQPQSALSRWYKERFAQGSRAQRKVGITALARKLLIAQWRFLETGALPDDALLKPTPSK